MTGRRAIIGLSLLCALVFCASAAPSAMALKGTTLFTCIKATGGGAGFSDEHCTKSVASGASYEMKEIKDHESTAPTVTNNETSDKDIPTKLLFTYNGTQIELEAKTFLSCAAGAEVEGLTVLEEWMVIRGEGCGTYSNVVVNKAKNCVIKGGTVTLNTVTGNGNVGIPPGGKEELMFLEWTVPGHEAFASFTLEKCENGELNKAYAVFASKAVNVVPSNMGTEGTVDGPTIKFTTTGTEKYLVVVAGGKEVTAKFEGTFTIRMKPEGGKETNPIVFATTKT